MHGFEALALSIRGARSIFGDNASYVVCVNTISVATAQALVGDAARLVEWLDCTNLMPDWLRKHIDYRMADGAAWKFAPVDLFKNRHVLALDNDVILWRMPETLKRWLDLDDTLLIAADVRCCYGAFAEHCPAEPRNSGIVGLPPGWPIEPILRRSLKNLRLSSECDEQGLQVAMITSGPHLVIGCDEVSISGYFRPHSLNLGACGAHFVGVNSKGSGARWQGRSVEQYAQEFWNWRKGDVADLVAAAVRSSYPKAPRSPSPQSDPPALASPHPAQQ